MKKITIAFFMAVTLLSTGLKAQTELRMSEINPYFDAYLEPFAGAMAVGMGGGWTTTANTHELFGFDITFSGSVVNIPTSDLTFDAGALNMPGINLSGNTSEAPSISASNDLSAPSIGKTVEVPGVGSGDFYFPGIKGLGINKGGSAALQVGFGLPKGTEIMVRFVPDISNSVNNILSSVGEIELSKTGMWGVGVKHDIKQWIPVVKQIPFLQMSAMLTYSSFNSGFSGNDLLFDPERMGATSSLPESTWDNQSFDFKMTSFTGALLIGANIPIFQPYIGLGFNSAKFEGGFNGNFPVLVMDIPDVTNPSQIQAVVNEYEENPLNVDFKGTGFNFQAGARVKLGLFILHYTYTASKYSMHTAGLGFTFR